MFGRRKPAETQKAETESKVLEVDASMQGTLTFKDPVNLRINGNFEGILETRGSLEVGQKASVKADIRGEAIRIAGEVIGDVKAGKSLRIEAGGRLIGDVETPDLTVESGAVLQGKLTMLGAPKAADRIERIEPRAERNPRVAEAAPGFMTPDELATYLAVEKAMIFEWADEGKLPAVKEGSVWKFEKRKVDEWVASGRIK